ncbi:hypothetical protein ABPG75_002482 [Micractinium tetrahymenae]
MAPTTSIYCVDASACALLSEDYPGTTRWHLQRELVTCHSQACLGSASGAASAASSQHQQVVLIAGSGGRASVVLHPTGDASALQQALDGVRPAGEGNLAAALKLALLVGRRFPQGSTRVTAFVASADAAASLAACTPAAAVVQELRQSYQQAGLALDIAVLCPREELGEAVASALEPLASSNSLSSSSASIEEAACSSQATAVPSSAAGGCGGAGGVSSSSTSLRLVWLQPVATAAESWQQLEAALELLEGGREPSGSGGAASTQLHPVTSSSGTRSVLPAQISRAPRQPDPLSRPRMALLAPRSGVQQPALCRGESLSRLGHLSSDGMMRPWLPTYSSLGKQAAAAARGAAGPARGPAAGAGSSDVCFVEVQPVPRWRTLLRVAAGRMVAARPEAANSGGSSSSSSSSGSSSSSSSSGSSSSSSECSPVGSGDFTAASSRLLRSLNALSVMDEAEQGDGSGGESSEAAPAAVPLRYRPDPQRGTLRLLQGTKEPNLLRLVWSAEPQASAGNGSSGGGGGGGGQQPAEAPFDMFGSAPSATSGGRPSSRHAELLSYMSASTVAASAARGPLLREGCELWEAAAEFDWELPLPTAEQEDGGALSRRATADGGSDGSAAARSCSVAGGELPAAVEARQLPNGAQVLMVTPARGTAPGRLSRQAERRRPPATTAFWLQQRLGPDSLQLPAYGTDSSRSPAAVAAPEGPASEPADSAEGDAPGLGIEQEPQQQQQPQAPGGEHAQPQQPQQPLAEHREQEGGEAALLEAALLGVLRRPPRVDLRRLRRDVKSGAIQVTPITVGPLPAQFVRDIVSARSAMLGGLGVENLDSWEGEGGPPKAGSTSGSSGSSSQSSSGPGSGASSGASSTTGSADNSPGEAGGQGDASAAPSPGSDPQPGSGKFSEAALQKHKAAAYSLLRQRLAKQPARGGSSGGAMGSGSVGASDGPSSFEQPASAAAGAAAAAGNCVGLPACAASVPCSSPQPTPAAPPRLLDSCSSSAAGTPFGTPLHILPSRLLQERRSPSCSQAGSAEDGEVPAGMAAAGAGTVAAAGQAVPGLPGAADGCLKREGSAVLASASSQADGAGDALDPMFPLE